MVNKKQEGQEPVGHAAGTCYLHLVQVVLNWYNLVAALAAGGVPFCD
jgi:hypothetical protein